MQAGDARRLARRSREVQGWFSAEAAELFGFLDEAQKQLGVDGDLFEIGVHHGKSAIHLAAMARPGEHLGVCDIFGGQGANVSQSGGGDRDVFLANMREYAPEFDRTRIFEKLSSDLTAEEIGGPYRFFHVDGGHLAEEALFDTQLAAAVSADGGTIVIDDPFRIEWPGVTEAILDFLRERRDWEPFVLGFNKLVLVPRDARAGYDAALAAEGTLDGRLPRGAYSTKTLPIAGTAATIFHVPPTRQIPALDLLVARAAGTAGALRRQVQERLPLGGSGG